MIYSRLIASLLLTGLFSICSAQLHPLPYRAIASRGSRSLDRIVMISANPDLLHIYDPSTTVEVTVALPKAPATLSVSPDGMHAAVGHDGMVSLIDLASATVLRTVAVSGTASTVVLSDRYAWFAAQGSGYSSGYAGVDFISGTSTGGAGLSYSYSRTGVVDAAQTSLYFADYGMQKVTVGTGLSSVSSSWPNESDYASCGPYYLSIDGTRLYTSCGTVVNSSTDKKLDMYYLRTLPVSSYPVAGMAESAGLKKLAVIASTYSYNSSANSPVDTHIELFDTDYLTPAGNIALLPFTTPSGTFAAHGQAVFFSKDDTRLYVAVQADSTSNLTNNSGVEVINIANPPACAVQLATTLGPVAASGALGTIGVAATADCFHAATTATDWIKLTGGQTGSGNATVTWIARANTGPLARAGYITINGQSYTVQQDGAPATASAFAGLSYNVADAEYSRALDRLIAVSASPDELHIYDPAGRSEVNVPLALPPFAVSVAPDGLHAAVGHDGWISYIDLHTAAVLKLYPIVTDVHHVLLAGNGYIYAFPQSDWAEIYSLEIASGTVTATNAIYMGRIPRLEPNGKYFYLSGGQWFSKWDITNGIAKSIRSNYGSGLGFSYWLYQDGSALISAGAKVYTSSDVDAQDAQYVGTYSNVTSLAWAADSTALRSTALIPSSPGDTSVMFVGQAYLGNAGSLQLPRFSAGGNDYAGHGIYAFWNSAATALYAIERADKTSPLVSTDAIYTISPSTPSPGCTATPAGALSTLPSTGGFGSALIAAGTGCAWSATSDAPWLVITAGGIGAGPATVSWSATANTAFESRVAHIAVGGQTYKATQLGIGSTPITVSPTALAFTAAWPATDPIAPQTITTNANANALTVTTSASWITVTITSPTTLSVSVNPSGMMAGTNAGMVTVTSADGQVQALAVTLTITPKLAITPASLTFRYSAGTALPTATLTMSDGTSAATSFSAYAYSLVNVKPTSGTLPATIQVSPTTTGVGTYSTTISIYSNGQSYSVPVKITVTGAPIVVSSIASGADLTTGPVSPGEIVTISGNGLGPARAVAYSSGKAVSAPKSLSGTSVSFNGYFAPILSTSNGSVSAIVPYEVAGLTNVAVVAMYYGSTSDAFAQDLAPTAPHFFTKTRAAAGQIVALNADSSANSVAHPAQGGSVVVLYATGEGVTAPPGVDGSLVGSSLTQPLANVTVTIGGQPATVLYAGGQPGSIEGLLQVDVRIPVAMAAGSAAVSMQIGAATTPAGATIEVK